MMDFRSRRTLSALCALSLLSASFSYGGASTAQAAVNACLASNEAISVFAFNDFHGRLNNAATLFSPVADARAAGENVLLLSQGDNIGASTFDSYILDDQPTLDVLNAIKVDSSTVGNHEFDKGWADLSGRVANASSFPYLAANVYNKGTTTVAAPLKAYETFTIAGVTVAVVGAVTDATPGMVSPAGVSTLTFGDPVEAVNRVTAELLDGNTANGEADIVIASFHEGAPNGSADAATNVAESTAFANIYNKVDTRVAAILNGHTHQNYSWVNANGAPVIQAGSYGSNLAKLVLNVDSTTHGLCSTQVSSVALPKTPSSDASIQQIQSIVAAAKSTSTTLGAQVVGQATTAISTPDGTAGVRNEESPLTNQVAQMFFDTLSNGNADFIGIQNPGGTRASFDAGEITYKEAADVLPFANSLFTTQITGAQFKTVLEQQWQRDAAGNVPSRPFLQLGLSKNVSYTYDESLPEGSRITDIFINGKPIDPAKLYTVGSGSFLISGGDQFWELGKGINTADAGRADLEAWVSWIKAQGTLSPDYSKRGVSLQTTGNTLTAGENSLTFTLGQALAGGVALQSLDMKLASGARVSPALANSTVTAYVGDLAVGTGTVTNGVGTVTISLPADTTLTSGDYFVRFVAADSGTVSYQLVHIIVPTKPTPTPSQPSVQPSGSTVTTPAKPVTTKPGLPKTGV